MENQTLTHLENTAKEIEHYTEGANMALTEMRLQFETLAEMQKEERLEQQRSFCDQMDKMRKHYGRIIAGLVVSLCLILGGIIGGTIYVLSAYDIAFGYTQNAYNDIGGDNIINDGIHFNDGFRDSDK